MSTNDNVHSLVNVLLHFFMSGISGKTECARIVQQMKCAVKRMNEYSNNSKNNTYPITCESNGSVETPTWIGVFKMHLQVQKCMGTSMSVDQAIRIQS